MQVRIQLGELRGRGQLQLRPAPLAGQVLDQQHTVVEQLALGAEHLDPIVPVVRAIFAHERQRRRPRAHHAHAPRRRRHRPHGDRGVFEVGLLGTGIDARAGDVVGAPGVAARRIRAAPVHRHKHHPRLDRGGQPRRHPHHPVAAGNRHGTALADAQAGGVVRVQLGERAPLVLAELGHLAGAGHGMPLVAQAAGGEHERIVRARGLVRILLRHRMQPGAAAGGREPAIGEQPLGTGMVRGGARPLDAAGLLQPGVVDSGHVERRAGGEPGVLGEDVRFRAVGERLPPTHAAGEVAQNPHVGPRLARRLHHLGKVSHAALRVGHGALLLQPAGRRQHHVGPAQPRTARRPMSLVAPATLTWPPLSNATLNLRGNPYRSRLCRM